MSSVTVPDSSLLWHTLALRLLSQVSRCILHFYFKSANWIKVTKWLLRYPVIRLLLEHKWTLSSHKHVMRQWSTRQESEPALISANLSFPSQKPQQNKPTNFHQKDKLWQLRFLGKCFSLFHDNIQAWFLLLIKFSRRKTESLLPGKDTHLIPSDLLATSYLMILLVNGQMPLWFRCPVVIMCICDI